MLLVVGCAPTRTAGTNGMAAKDLAVLSVPQLPNVVHVQIDTVQFDDQSDRYSVGKSRDFYLLPGDHTATFTLVANIPGPTSLLVPRGALNIPSPKNIRLGSFTAGKSYELAPTLASFESLFDGRQPSLVREKAK